MNHRMLLIFAVALPLAACIQGDVNLSGAVHNKGDDDDKEPVTPPQPNLKLEIGNLGSEAYAFGSEITLQGKKLGNGTSSGVRIGGKDLTIVSWTDTRIVAKLDAEAEPGANTLAVRAVTATATVAIQIKPSIVSATYINGDEPKLRIAGHCLGAAEGAASVTPATGTTVKTAMHIIAWSPVQIEALIPDTLAWGPYLVSLTSGATAAGLAQAVSIPLEILGVSPAVITGQTEVQITGRHFGPRSEAVEWWIGSRPATVSTWTPTSLVARADILAEPGTATVRAEIGGISQDAQPITIDPRLTGVYPSSLTGSATFSVKGMNLGAANADRQMQAGLIFFYPGAGTATTVTASLPDLLPGQVDVRLHINGRVSNALPIVVTRPWINTRAPHLVITGTPVTLTGDDFGAAEGAAYMDGAIIDTSFWSNGSVTAVVPGVLTGGLHAIHLVTSDGAATNRVPVISAGGAIFTGPGVVASMATAVWTGKEMIIWGGLVSGVIAGGWRYNPATDTWIPLPTAGEPTPRYMHTATWTGTGMVIVGGYGGEVLGDGASYSPFTDQWSALPVTGAPTARYGHTTIWTGEKVLVWGGRSGAATLANGYRYDPLLRAWANVTANNAPQGRFEHSAVWTGARMLVWGGARIDDSLVEDAGAYDPDANVWFPLAQTGAPSARRLHTAVWTGDQMLVWGGQGPGDLDTGGRYDPVADGWSTLGMTGVPGARAKHVAVWTGHEMIVWGGYANGYLNDGARYSPATDEWAVTSTLGRPSARREAAAVWTGDEMLVWGGANNTGMLGMGGRYDPDTDTWAVLPDPVEFETRGGAVTVWTGTEVLVWSGSGQSAAYSNGFRYQPAQDQWVPMNGVNAPSARSNAQAVWTGERMFVWGGQTQQSAYSPDGGVYNPAADSWSATDLSGAIAGRVGFSMEVAEGTVLIYGGQIQGGSAADFYQYYPLTDTYATLAATGGPGARAYSASVYTGEELIVWSSGSGAAYAPATGVWRTLGAYGAGVTRRRLSGVWTGEHMIIWGGEDGSTKFNTGAKYDPANNSWQSISTTNAPVARYGHTAAWTGDSMVIFGGVGADHLRTGGVYDADLDTWTALPDTGAWVGSSQPVSAWMDDRLFILTSNGPAFFLP